jgi:hypothetical protein
MRTSVSTTYVFNYGNGFAIFLDTSRSVGSLIRGNYAQWLNALLYLHVPDCNALCLYCGCTTKAVLRRAPVEVYADLIRKEIESFWCCDRRQAGGLPALERRHAVDPRSRHHVDMVDRLSRTLTSRDWRSMHRTRAT